MQFFTAGEDITVTVPFTRDGEPFVPDAAALVWYLRAQDGTKGSTTALTCTNSSAEILVVAASNAIPGGQRFSKRFLCVSGTVGGLPFTAVSPYSLIPWINTTVTPDDVRSYIGITNGELSDGNISIPDAYFAVVDSIGDESILIAALHSGVALEAQANLAILTKAVMDVVPGLQLRLSQSENDGSLQVERLGNIDLEGLYKLATLEYADAITALSGRTVIQRQPFIVTTPTDPVTGH